MDLKVKSLLDDFQICKNEEKDKILRQVLQIFFEIDNSQFSGDLPESVSMDMYIKCAQLAITNRNYDIAEQSIKLYFTKAPATDPQKCDAYLCLAKLSAPTSNTDLANLKESSENILRAISMALKNPVLSGKVYEASVLYWRFCYRFIRPEYHLYVTDTLSKIVQALAETNEPNFEWRGMLSITLIECYIESKQKAAAIEAVNAVSFFVKHHASSQYLKLFHLMIVHQLVNSDAIQKEINSSIELFVFYNICQIEQNLKNNETKKNYKDEILILMSVLNVPLPSDLEEGISKSEKLGIKKQLSKSQSPRARRKTLLRNPNRPNFLLELARLCLKLDFIEFAQRCIHTAKSISDSLLNIQLEFVNCELLVHSLGDKQESCRKKSIQTRLTAIKYCEDNLIKAIRQNDNPSIQYGCLTLWNLSLPLLMWNLRSYLRKPLILVAQALEDIQSLFMQLRCQVHLELAQCEEETEHIRLAIKHLQKAIALDDTGLYTEKLKRKLHRLTLRSELYKQPERAENIAAMIIEQANSANNTGSVEMKRALLMKACSTLAPHTFHLVLDSEKLFHDTHIKLMPRTSLQLAKCVHHYNVNINKSNSYLRRLSGKTDDTERLHLWADLVKIARKQEVWDVCRTATQFCLLYDDGRWQAWQEKGNNPKPSSYESVGTTGKNEELLGEHTLSPKKPNCAEFEKSPLAERELIRLLAEINFIRGEALIRLLRKENVELNDEPVFPTDMSKRPKSYSSIVPAEDKNWNIYTEWISQLNSKITACFIRGLEHGTSLKETWLVGNAAVYFWNYSTHIIRQSRYSEITETLNSILEGFKKVGYKGFEQLLINICMALAYGFITPWMPVPVEEKETPPPTPPKGKRSAHKTIQKSSQIVIPQEATPYLKKAIEVCEYAMEVLNDKEAKKLISQSAKMSLLKVWVISKQMAQQQISKIWIKNENSSNIDDEKLITQIIVYLEMHSLTKNGVMEFRDLPSLSDIVCIMEKCSWNDNLVKLQLLTCLAYLLFNQKMHDRIIYIVQPVTNSYLEALSSNENSKKKKTSSILNPSESEKVSHLFLVMGQSLQESSGQQFIHQADVMGSFLNAAKFGCIAGNYELVISAAHHFWNSISHIYNICSERSHLKKPLKQILSNISEVINKCQNEQAKKQPIINTPSPIKEPRITIYGPIGNFMSNDVILDKKEDLTLRVSLYNLLFQCYSDQEDWENGLKVLDTAIPELPSTHRMQLFRQRVLTKTRLGINMSLDFQKFKGEKENIVSSLWRDVALNSQQVSDQLVAYQKAIEILVGEEYKWQKVDYLLEFGQWLYTHQFPIKDVLDMMEWAVDILMGMQFELPLSESPETSAKNINPEQNSEPKKKDEKLCFKPTQSNMTEESDNFNPINYIPQEKKILIGTLPLSTILDIKNLNNIKQLDYLIKCHVLLSDIYSPSSQFFYQYSLLAYDFVNRIWQLTFSVALPILQEISLRETPQSTKNSEKVKEKGRSKKEKSAEGNSTSAKDKNKKKTFIMHLPQTPEEWATFEFPDELLEIFKQESLKYCGINKSCFDQPWLTVHYLIKLMANLRQLRLHHLALPVVVLCRAIALNVLESQALTLLTHCKSMQICSELNHKNGSILHESAVSRMLENEIPDIIQMKETAERYKHENIMPSSITETASLSELERKKLADAKSHLGFDLRNGILYWIWTDVAEQLIIQSRYQKARQFLTESYKFADCFKDKICKGRISYLIAKLAFVETQYKTTFNFCLEIQKNHSANEYYWYKTVSLLCKVVTQPSFMHDYILAQKILASAIETLEQCTTVRVNQAAHLNIFIVKLRTKLAETKAKDFLKKFDHFSEETIQESILSFESDFQTSTKFLLQHNFKLKAITVIESQASVWHQVAFKAKKYKDLQQKYYMECIDLYQMAISEIQNILYSIVAITPIEWQISLPMKRKLADVQLKYSTVLIEIDAIQLEEEIVERKMKEVKDPILLTVEELTAPTPVFFAHQKKWIESKYWIADEILSQVTSAHHMTRDIPSLCSKSLLTLGYCLLQISLRRQCDAPKTWHISEMGLAQVGTENEHLGRENIQQADDQHNILFSESSYVSSKNKKIVKCHKISVNFLFQASECFLQSLDLALEYKLFETATAACLGLVNLIGQYDNPICTQFLAMYQSCNASIYMQNLLEQSQNNPRSNRLAALLHQRKHLLQNDLKNNFSNSNIFGCLSHCLQTEWQAWKRCQISANHLCFQKEFPPNFYFIILQHSPDKKFLYASFMDKNKVVKSAVSTKQQSGASSSPLTSMQRAGIFGCPVNEQDLLQLLEMAQSFKKEAQKNYIKRSIQLKHQTQCLNMLERLKYCMEDTDEPIFEPILEVHDWMQDTFMDLIKSMENYLAPVLEPLTAALQTVISMQPSSVNAHTKEHREFLVLLADADLLELPLEALSYFRKYAEILSLSREISLQMFYHRLQPETQPEEPKDGKKKDKKPPEPPSRLHPAGMKVSVKKGKSATLDRTLPSWAQPIDTTSFKYIVDPFNECHEDPNYNPVQIFKKATLQYEQYFTSHWLGLFGSDHIPSPGEWEVYLNNSGSFIFYGPNKLTTHLKPSKLSAFNLSKCLLLCQLDLSENYLSFDRYSHVNAANKDQNFSLESPLQTTILLSLAGVRCVIGNQWTSSMEENANHLQNSMKYLLEEGLSTGETLHHIQTPYLKRVKYEETTAEDLKSKSPSKKSSRKKGEKVIKVPEIQEPTSAKNLIQEKSTLLVPITDLQQEWYNTVCYGLPNLIVTQIQ